MDDVTAFILAGGKSTRMGQDKAFLEIDGQTLLERAIAKAREVAGHILIVGERAKFATFGVVVEDIFRERGPLGAIHAGLAASATELNLVLAVDMPFVPETFLTWLIREARRSNTLVTVVRVGGRLQPLCGVYRKSFSESALQSLQAGENKIDRLFSAVPTCVIEEEQLVSAGFSAEMFRNVNTREEWEEVMSTESRVPRKNLETSEHRTGSNLTEN